MLSLLGGNANWGEPISDSPLAYVGQLGFGKGLG